MLVAHAMIHDIQCRADPAFRADRRKLDAARLRRSPCFAARVELICIVLCLLQAHVSRARLDWMHGICSSNGLAQLFINEFVKRIEELNKPTDHNEFVKRIEELDKPFIHRPGQQWNTTYPAEWKTTYPAECGTTMEDDVPRRSFCQAIEELNKPTDYTTYPAEVSSLHAIVRSAGSALRCSAQESLHRLWRPCRCTQSSI